MSEWRSFIQVLKWSRGGALVLLSTFFLTVFVDLNMAIEIGMILAMFLFMKRMSDATSVKIYANDYGDDETADDYPLPAFTIPRGVEVYEINGPLFFGVANSFDEIDRQVGERPKVRILRFKDVPIIDSTGMQALRSFYNKCKRAGIKLIITGVHVQPLNEMIKSNLYDLIGEENVFGSMKDSLERANEIIKNSA
jgi:SulP family sulfate permease